MFFLSLCIIVLCVSDKDSWNNVLIVYIQSNIFSDLSVCACVCVFDCVCVCALLLELNQMKLKSRTPQRSTGRSDEISCAFS